jgi:hypothetical protein
MINQGNDVPDKTIAVFSVLNNYSFYDNKKDNRLSKIIEKPSKKRNWFNPHFYRCLPLTIGNQYGFVIKSEFDFTFIWDGGDSPDAIKFWFNEEQKKIDEKFPRIETHFGSGIITINPPFVLRTPPGVNLMTVSPPNYVIPNITVMTGVVETDNIRRNFTFNLKVQMPNIPVQITAGSPIAAFIPIPRYYADSFELKYAEEIFNEETTMEEYQTDVDTETFRREIEPTLPHTVGRQYLNGEDIYGNKFPDHQK